MKVFITGLAGMIGARTAEMLVEQGHEVYGCDNYNDYYDPLLKKARAKKLSKLRVQIGYYDILDKDALRAGIKEASPDVVLHLAAYANPRHSLREPRPYIDTNIHGTQNLIEVCEELNIQDVVYASSSCVMHGQPLPWNEQDLPGHQNNPYGWSKRSNECQFMHSNLSRTTGLRFFTVYGPYGRPDMALFLFTKGIIERKPIIAFNNGNMTRDFTYVDDIANGVIGVLSYHISLQGEKFSEIFNIGRGEPVKLMDFIKAIESKLDRKAIIDYQPKHPADVPMTWADTTKLQNLIGYKPIVSIEEGVNNFIDWYLDYYKINMYN